MIDVNRLSDALGQSPDLGGIIMATVASEIAPFFPRSRWFLYYEGYSYPKYSLVIECENSPDYTFKYVYDSRELDEFLGYSEALAVDFAKKAGAYFNSIYTPPEENIILGEN